MVTDVDGTLLDGYGVIPDAFWSVLDGLRRAGITFAVASGRQYPSLERLFARDPHGIVFIADNGGYVVQDGVEVAALPLGRAAAVRAARATRALGESHDLGVIWSCRGGAFAERHDETFIAHAAVYYPDLQRVDDVTTVAEDPIKLSILELSGVDEASLIALEDASGHARVVQASHEWIDVMDPRVNKGAAVAALQRSLGVGRDQTVVFGDYLNDLELMDSATYSFAMANAHPEVVSRARAVAPSNVEHGAVTTMAALLGEGSA